MKAKEYYNRVAEKYSAMITRGIGGTLKDREKNCLMGLLSPKEGEKILDVGCGSGFYASLIKRCGASVFCVDISPGMVEVVKSLGIEAEVHDVEKLSLNRRFDKVLCAGPLEFCKSPLAALENLRHHLSKEGCMVLSVLNVSLIGVAYKIYHLSHGISMNLFSLNRITALLDQAGFNIEKIEKPTSFMYAIRARL